MTTTITARDIVTLPDGDYQVVGQPEDYSSGPYRPLQQSAPRFTVSLRRYLPGITDSHNNVVGGHAEPVDIEVFGWAPAGTSEPKLAGHDRVVVDLELFVPPLLVVNLQKVEG